MDIIDSDTEFEIKQNEINEDAINEIKRRKQREYCKKYYIKNREALLEKYKNSESCKEYKKAYFQKEEVKQKRVEYNKRYYEKRKAKLEAEKKELEELRKKLNE